MGVSFSGLPGAAALVGGEIFPADQSGTTKQVTFNQVATFVAASLATAGTFATASLSNVSGANFLAKAGTAGVVVQTITTGVLTSAPSQDAVFTALAAKLSTSAATFVRYDVNSQGLTGTQQTNAQTNLGLGSMALQASGAVAITGGTVGGVTASSLTITSGSATGLTDVYSVRYRSIVTALAALNHDCSADGDHVTKSISANSTFTVSNIPGAGAYGFSMKLIITSAAVPTWFANVRWAAGVAPTLGNGTHLLFFFTDNAGTDWLATYGKAFA